ncbi:MAG TPA: AAA-like domain-containing protein [Crinalium sp.]|jgi:hypothetical protein
MTVEEALAIVDEALAPECLNTVHELVFRKCWVGQTYHEIAASSGYTSDYIRIVGSQLWQTLSKSFNEKVTKHNFRSIIRRRSQELKQKIEPIYRSEIAPVSEHPLSLMPDFPDGLVPLNSPFYINRPPAEERAYEGITQPGALLRIRSPQRWGKTSLIVRVLAHAEALGYQTARLSFQQADAAVLADLDKLLRWFCADLTQQLQLEVKLDDYWNSDLSSKVSCTTYLRRYILSRLESPLVLALDEIDRLFNYPSIAQDFLPLLRFWYEEASHSDAWQKLRLIVAHSTEFYIPLNLSQSPFNVGLPITLREFTLEEIHHLARLHRLSWADTLAGMNYLTSLYTLTAGHPYLVRLALYHFFEEETSVGKILREAPTDAGIYGGHLRKYLATLTAHPELGSALMTVIMAKAPVRIESIAAYKLASMGLVKFTGNEVELGCELYRLYFHDRLTQ